MKSRILLVDDDDSLRRVMSRALERMGYEVYSAEGGLTALRMADIARPDILIVDYGMAMPGTEIVRRVRGRYGSSVHICVLTGEDKLSVRQSCLAAGADEILEKPVTMIELRMHLAAASALPHAPVAYG